MGRIILTREEVRALDRRAIQQWGWSSLVLMENAGRGVVDVLFDVDPALQGTQDPEAVTIVCGKGNNGGDGFVIARHLAIRGVGCRVFLAVPEGEIGGDARANLELLQRSGIPIAAWSEEIPSKSSATSQPARGRWLIDGLLGTGSHGSPRPPYDAIIHWMNAQSCQKLALDVPSGLDCDTGEAAEPTFRADHTCTFAALKVGFEQPASRAWTGAVHVVSIGIPPALLVKKASD